MILLHISEQLPFLSDFDGRKRNLLLYHRTAAYTSLLRPLMRAPYPGGCFLLRMAVATSCAMVNAAVRWFREFAASRVSGLQGLRVPAATELPLPG